jgi:hypothetical protein
VLDVCDVPSNTSELLLVQHIIYDWEKSGNGFGQRALSDAGWGHFSAEHHQHEDGDNRANFLRTDYYNKEHLLYLWHLGDTLGILSNMLNVLSKEVAIDCNGEIEVSCSLVQRKRKKPKPVVADDTERLDRNRFRQQTSTALSFMAVSAMKAELSRALEFGTLYEIKALDATLAAHRRVYDRKRVEQEVIASGIRSDLDRMEAAVAINEEQDQDQEEAAATAGSDSDDSMLN